MGTLVDIIDQIKERVSLRDVVAGYTTFSPKNRKMAVCPFHEGDKNASMQVDDKGANSRFHCHGCGIDGDVVDFICFQHGVDKWEAVRLLNDSQSLGIKIPERKTGKPNNRPVPKICTGKAPKVTQSDNEALPSASISVRDKTYRILIKSKPMDERTRADMIRRGCNKDDLDWLVETYRVFTYIHTEADARSIQREGGTVRAVAGFYNGPQSWLSVKGEGTGIAAISRDMEIGSIQVRPFAEGSKYTYLTSNGWPDGAKAIPQVHYATEFTYDFTEDRYRPILHGDTIRVTEGGIKGNLIHRFENSDVITIQGVHTVANLQEELIWLKSQGIKKVLDTFDMDGVMPDKNGKIKNSVVDASNNLKEMVLNAGLLYERSVWDVNPKGRDDIYLKGYDDYLAYHLRGILPH